MKTRQEMVYDFMIALVTAGNSESWDDDLETWGEYIKRGAEELTDIYLKGLG
jgi:hypothetical protein